MKAIAIRQPWASLIIEGHKPIENRRWSTAYRGPLLIYASRTWDEEIVNHPRYEEFKHLIRPRDEYQYGGIIGLVILVDMLTAEDPRSENPWFDGRYGFLLEHPRPLPFKPIQGRLSIFEVPYQIPEESA